jgi:hypothetical protein
MKGCLCRNNSSSSGSNHVCVCDDLY